MSSVWSSFCFCLFSWSPKLIQSEPERLHLFLKSIFLFFCLFSFSTITSNVHHIFLYCHQPPHGTFRLTQLKELLVSIVFNPAYHLSDKVLVAAVAIHRADDSSWLFLIPHSIPCWAELTLCFHIVIWLQIQEVKLQESNAAFCLPWYRSIRSWHSPLTPCLPILTGLSWIPLLFSLHPSFKFFALLKWLLPILWIFVAFLCLFLFTLFSSLVLWGAIVLLPFHPTLWPVFAMWISILCILSHYFSFSIFAFHFLFLFTFLLLFHFLFISFLFCFSSSLSLSFSFSLSLFFSFSS